jgi:hypothetical protein
MTTVETPLGTATLWPSGIGYFDETETITSVQVRLEVPRPGTKSKSVWQLQFGVPYDYGQDPDSERRGISIHGSKKDGLGRDVYLGSYRRKEWGPVIERIKREVLPVIVQWIADNEATRNGWQREALLRAAGRYDGKAERAESEAVESRAKAAYYRERAAAL